MALDQAEEARRATVLRDLELSGAGLEVGPSYNPLAPKERFPGVRTLDHADAGTLRAKYAAMGLPAELIARIEEVDYISDGGSIADTVGPGTTFDFIVGSHLIEHTVDLIGFLQDCERLLAPGGRLALVVPDKRYCFDYFQTLTTVGDVVDAHLRPTRFHPPGALLNHMLYATKVGEATLAWSPGAPEPMSLQFASTEVAAEWLAIGQAQEAYFDLHRWRFTPASLTLLLSDLAALGYHHLRPVRPCQFAGHEFYVTLEYDPAYVPEYDAAARLAALREIEHEVQRPLREAAQREAAAQMAAEQAAGRAGTSRLAAVKARLKESPAGPLLQRLRG